MDGLRVRIRHALHDNGRFSGLYREDRLQVFLVVPLLDLSCELLLGVRFVQLFPVLLSRLRIVFCVRCLPQFQLFHVFQSLGFLLLLFYLTLEGFSGFADVFD